MYNGIMFYSYMYIYMLLNFNKRYVMFLIGKIEKRCLEEIERRKEGMSH